MHLPAPFRRASVVPLALATIGLLALTGPFCGIGTASRAWAQTATTATAATTPFTTEVLRNFDAWDTNKDGTLSEAEVDARVSDPHVTGEPAAALGALKLLIRGGKVTLPPLTRDYFQQYSIWQQSRRRTRPGTPPGTTPTVIAPAPGTVAATTATTATAAVPPTTPTTPGTPSPANGTAAATTPYPTFDRMYTSALNRIRKSPPDVFAGSDGPRLSNVHQGAIGDCYFLAAVGGLLNRDPEKVRKMIGTVQPDGSCDVTLAEGHTVHLVPPTDAEVAVSSTTTQTGRWLPLLEKAFGQDRNGSRSADSQKAIPTDLIAKGGSVRASIRYFTGHTTESITFRKKGEDAVPSVDAVTPLLPRIREAVTAATKEGRLLATYTGQGTRPPAINNKHAYAVLGYDATTDTIRVWNPHGNTFHPKGAPGVENGFETVGGVFTLPLVDFARTFNGVTWETTTPVPAAKS